MSAPPIVKLSRRLARQCDRLEFGPPVAYVYNPVDYAREPHEAFLRRFGVETGRVLMVGMNPGPWGMAQTGVPFGDPVLVRDWMGIDGNIGHPDPEHPKVPIMGFESHRREGSGKRLWGWAKEHAGSAEAFFQRYFVWNYCPLCFLAESGANITPVKLAKGDREALLEVCDRGLQEVVELVAPRAVIGIGNFAEARLRAVLGEDGVPIHKLLHPSPANPRANRDWPGEAERVLRAVAG